MEEQADDEGLPGEGLCAGTRLAFPVPSLRHSVLVLKIPCYFQIQFELLFNGKDIALGSHVEGELPVTDGHLVLLCFCPKKRDVTKASELRDT